jgi:hypothetical protein
MHPQLTLIVAQQHIADLHRAADHNRLVRTATAAAAATTTATATATSSHAVPRTPPRRRRRRPVSFLRWLRSPPDSKRTRLNTAAWNLTKTRSEVAASE